jgi:sporulation protein YlmC with PRC-barrel domain
MVRIVRISYPVVAAALVLTARTEDPQSQPPRNGKQSAQAAGKDSKLSQDRRNQQSTFQPGQISESQLKKTVTEVNKASSFIGMAVKNMQNENLGKVHDLVFDPENGKISYAVVSVGGVLGVGDKLIAIPVTSLKPQPGQKHLVLNMDKNQVQSAPGLAQNNWPDLDAPGIGASAGSESVTSSSTGRSSEERPSSTSESSSTEKSRASLYNPDGADQPQSSTRPNDSSKSSSSTSTPETIGSNSDASASAPNEKSTDTSTSRSDSNGGKDQ